MKSKKQIRHKNKSNKFMKMKGAGPNFSMPMTNGRNTNLISGDRIIRQAALEEQRRQAKAQDLAQQERNTDRLRRVAAVLQHQNFPEIASLNLASNGMIDEHSFKRLEAQYFQSPGYLNKVKEKSYNLWTKIMDKGDLKKIFIIFMNIYNDKRPEDSKLLNTHPEQHKYLYYTFTKHRVDYENEFNELYKNVVAIDIENKVSFETENYIFSQQFFYGIENEILFYESILEALEKYNEQPGIVRGGKRKTKKRKSRRRKSRIYVYKNKS